MELTLRQLNRATLARQLLLERQPLTPARAIERVCAVQAQWQTSPQVGLWSRTSAFDRAALTRARGRRQVVRGTLWRRTLHLASTRDYLAYAALVFPERESNEARLLREALADGPRTWADLARSVDGVALQRGPTLPLLHEPPAGDWKVYGRVPLVDAERWLGRPLGDPAAGARLLVRRYLAAFGPASRADLLRFSGLRAADVSPALESLRLRELRADDGRALLDLPGADLPPADARAPVRFLGRWDNAHLGYDARARILPDEHAGRQIGLAGDQAFLVDGFVAGAWTIERAASSATLVLEPFAPLPRAARREVEDEGGRLVAWHEDEAGVHRVRWS